MSRLGRKPVVIPAGVTVTVDANNKVSVKGAKGTLTNQFKPEIKIAVKGNEVNVTRINESKPVRALHGTTRMLILNMIKGVSDGFEKNLETVGVGYRFAAKGTGLELSLGYSHPVEYAGQDGIKFSLEGQTGCKVGGIDKALVGQTAAEIREFRKPEPYKGKGVKYKTEVVKRKAGKAGKTGGTGGAA